jgi:hypothetical protein
VLELDDGAPSSSVRATPSSRTARGMPGGTRSTSRRMVVFLLGAERTK